MFRVIAISTYSGIQDYLFATIPLFVLMGLLVSISDVGKDTFDVCAGHAAPRARRPRHGDVGAKRGLRRRHRRLDRERGGLHQGRRPEMLRHGYTLRFATGTVAGSSILGMLIPPSLLMIIYGVLAEVSIGKMFIAGAIPGLLIAAGFAIMIFARATLSPGSVMVDPARPKRCGSRTGACRSARWRQARADRGLWP